MSQSTSILMHHREHTVDQVSHAHITTRLIPSPLIGPTKKLLDEQLELVHYEQLALKLRLEELKPSLHELTVRLDKLEHELYDELLENDLELKQEMQRKELEVGLSIEKLSLEGKSLFPSTSEVPYKLALK